MKISFPGQDKKYLQTNRSNVVGNLWSTFNIDLESNLGVMRIGTKLKLNTNTAGAANLGCPVAFREFDGRIFTIGGTRIFKNTADNVITAFVEDISTNAVTNYSPGLSDMDVFNGELYTTSSSKLWSKVADGSGTGAWTDRFTFTSSIFPHRLTYFQNFNREYFTDSSTQVKSINTSHTVSTSGDYTIDLGINIGYINCLASSGKSIWIGTSVDASVTGNFNKIGNASIFEWDGISAQATNEYFLTAQGCMAITIYKNILYAMDSNGVFLRFNGNGFDEIGRLPLDKQLLIESNSASFDNFIHPNGIIPTKNETFLMLINNLIGDNAGSIVENLPSGIWQWSADKGLVHNTTFTYMPMASSTITDFGQNRIKQAGALSNANLYSTSASGRGTIICGCNYYTDASASTSGIFIDSPIPTDNTTTPEGQKRGYFVTTWFESDQIAEGWTRLWGSYRRFLNSTDKIVFKYRNYEESPIEAIITWIDTQNFTTTTDITVYGPTAVGFNGTTGGEVEIVQGTGGGVCAHITNIVNNAGTYTVTIDEAATGASGTAKARFQKWIKLNPAIPLDQVRAWSQFGIDNESTPRIQIKGCLTFTGNGELYKIVIASNPDIKINL